MTKRILKIGALMGAAAIALFLVAGLHTSGTAHAQAPTATPTANPNKITVNTNTQVISGGGAVPIVSGKWELPDMQTATGFQYAASPATDLNYNGIDDADDAPLTAGMQMYPNLCDEPSQRDIQYWIVAEDPNGKGDITAAWDKVWEPPTQSGLCLDGTAPVAVPGLTDPWCYKYQVDTVEQLCPALGTFDESHNPSVTTLSAALKAAVDTNQITQAAAELLVQRCYKNEVRVFLGTKTLEHHQPLGPYWVRANVQDRAANIGILWNTFTVLPIIGLRIDFSLVDWGQILPGLTANVSGNEILDGGTGNNSTTPTVKDCGNANMKLTLNFAPMVNQSDPTEVITSFDARFMGQTIDPITAGTPVTFSSCYIPCHPKELDLSIHPGDKLPTGVYSGTLDVTGGLCGGGEPGGQN
jgi:hypothetical protein